MRKCCLIISLFGLPAFVGVAQPSSLPASPSVSGGRARTEGMKARGDQAMGFRYDAATHHFLLSAEGGSIDVEANHAADIATREAIRSDLSRVAAMFSAGDFSVPMFIHGTPPPGLATMKQLGGGITYQAEDTTRGARIRMVSRDPAALRAIHDFLRFEIADHHTGDPLEVQTQTPGQPRPGDNVGRDAHLIKDRK